MRKKTAVFTLLLMIFNLLFGNIPITNVYAADEPVVINKITIREEVEVINGQLKTNYQVIFNGFPMTNIDAIHVVQGGSIKKTLPKEELRVINSGNIAYVPDGGGQSIQSIFGATGTVYFRVVRNGVTHAEDMSKPFELPGNDFNFMKVDTINTMSPASWPITVIKGKEFTLEGSYLNNDYKLGITTGLTVTNTIDYNVVEDGRKISIGTDTVNIAAGNNQNLVFEKNSGSNVELRYVVKRAISVANPLDLEEVNISPLEGTAGSIVRIKAKKTTALLDSGTKVFIGGKEAVRNTGGFSDGTFTYYEGAEKKTGLEIVVPKLDTAGPKPIVIQNYFGDTYTHNINFIYVVAEGSVLEVMDVDPAKAFTNEEKAIDHLRVRNIVPVNNIKGIRHQDHVTSIDTNNANLKFFKEIDPKAKYLRYTLNNGEFVERKINIMIGLPADIVELPLLAPQDVSTLRVRTDKVSQAGKYVISVRTETVHYRLVGGVVTELNYIVEEAPYASQSKVQFEFEPDISTPNITRLVPNKGPFTEDITATIEGSNFRVESIGGKRYYPMIIIGSESVGNAAEKYKIITRNQEGKTVYYYSDRADGTNLGEAQEADFDLIVLTANNTVVDGQAIRSGTKIKFTIPKGYQLYNGYADVIVYNPSPLGALGGRDRKDNLFEYVTPGEGTILKPTITSVTPDKVAVGKPQQIVVKGFNFQPGAVVTIDGEVIQNRTIDVAKGTITFNSPAGRAGKTFLQVINPDGGFVSAPFEYVQTFSQPQIQRIIPNVGGKGSLVIIKGTGFFTPNPTGQTDAYKIGTTVWIDGKDVNRGYFRENDDPLAPLELRDFINDYFEDEMPIYGPNGEVLKTYGGNVAVVDNETIYVLIPDPKDLQKPFFMNAQLDVKVVNPDLGSHQLNKSFRFIDVVTRPIISKVEPNLGDYRGGNIVEIQGENFYDNVKVYFGTQQAQVYRRSNNARMLWVYVPPYGEDMGSKNAATVPVTILNNDGGSFTLYNGYKYVNPGYDAKITKLTPNTGNTAGGDRVLISGVSFRAKDFGTDDQQLPAVYFGGVKVPKEDITFVLPPRETYGEIETTDLIIVEKTPPNIAGRADVTVINFDGATANLKNGFEYRSKQPAISQVLPNQGSRLGGSEITIVGKDFVEKGLHVVFGNETGKADVLSGQATVKLGDVIVRYNAYVDDYNITLYYKEAVEGNQLMVYKEGLENPTNQFKIVEEEEFIVVRVPWKDVDSTTNNMADEQIKIEVKNNDLVVTRRLGVIKQVEGEQRITLVTPPSSEVGQKQLRVFNYDGKFATSQFTYTNPFRPPVIRNMIPVSTQGVNEINGVTYNPAINIDVASAAPVGGSPLIIEGENFRSGVKVFIGDKEATIKTKSANDDELIVIVPAAAPNTVGPFLRILVVNQDGGSAYGDIVPTGQTRNPYYFKYIPEGSSPKITSVSPAEGPVSGGTKVTIKGTEFKDQDTFGNAKTVSVLVGGIPVPQSSVRYINPQTLEVTMPAGRVGKQTIEVINYDHGRGIATDIFTYISQPQILTVDPNKIFTNDTDTTVTISGQMFQKGAKVIIGGTLVLEKEVKTGQEIKATGIRGVDTQGNNRTMVVVGGKEAANVVVENENTIKVKFNEAVNLQNNHLIIVNPDGGLSSEYKDFKYMIPVPSRPLVLEGIPGAESSIKLVWSDSAPELLNRADRYEIYGKKSTDGKYIFIGDTRSLEFLVKELQPNTNYSFMVRAMNKYGSSLEFAEVTVRTFNQREDQQLKDKNDTLDKEKQKLDKEGKVEISEGRVVRTIGKDEIKLASVPYLLDFSLSQYKDQNKYVVAIPVATVQLLHRQITIYDGNVNFTISPRDLYTREVSQVPLKDLNDAHVRIEVERLTGQTATSLYTAVGRTQRRASETYEITFQLQVGRNTTEIGTLLRAGELSFNFDSNAYSTANANKLFVGQYDSSKHSFNKVNDGRKANVRQQGRFILLSDR